MREDFGILLRLAQSDTQAMASLSSSVRIMAQRLRQNQPIHMTFGTTLPQAEIADAGSTPIPGTLRYTSNAASCLRLKSSVEVLAHYRTAVGTSDSNDRDNINLGPPKGRSCTICQESGHRKGRCPKLSCYKAVPLPFDDRSIQMDLSSDLLKENTFAINPSMNGPDIRWIILRCHP